MTSARVEIPLDRKRFWAFFAACLAAAAATALALVINADLRRGPWLYGILTLMLLLAGVLAYRLSRKTPALWIDEHGIGGPGYREIGWNEIADVFASGSSYGMSYLCVVPKARERVMARQPIVARLSAPFNQALVGAPITLQLGHLDRSASEVMELVHEHFRRASPTSVSTPL